MTAAQILQDSLLEPFRIGLLVMLFITMLRTRAVTGMVLPLAIGAVFVAGLISMSMQTGAAEPLSLRLGFGLLANLMILAVIYLVWMAIERLRKS